MTHMAEMFDSYKQIWNFRHRVNLYIKSKIEML